MTTRALDVIAISRSRGVAVLSDGNQAMVATWLGDDGEECEAPDALVAVVHARDDLWIVVDLSDFAVATYH